MEIKINSTVKKFIGDLFLNIIANALPIVALHLFILPFVSSELNGDDYGLVVTYTAMLNVFPSAFGMALNNIRLLYDETYKENEYAGDFPILLIGYIISSTAATLVCIFVFERSFPFVDGIFILIVSGLVLLRDYYRVAFRLALNYRRILINNLFLCAGYFLGTGIFLITGKWQFIHMTGTFASLAHIVRKTGIWKEPIAITPLFKNTSKESLLLLLSALLGRVTTYADKLILYPLLGGALVAVYYAATVFGKVVSLVVTPINSVALSYLSKFKRKSNRVFYLTLGITAAAGMIGYFLCLLTSGPVLGLLYPKYADQAIEYITITTAVIVLQLIISSINPFLMKFFKMKWQAAVNGAIAVVYIAVSLPLLRVWGLMGFCVGSLITHVIKIAVMLIIYQKSQSLYEEHDSAREPMEEKEI